MSATLNLENYLVIPAYDLAFAIAHGVSPVINGSRVSEAEAYQLIDFLSSRHIAREPLFVPDLLIREADKQDALWSAVDIFTGKDVEWRRQQLRDTYPDRTESFYEYNANIVIYPSDEYYEAMNDCGTDPLSVQPDFGDVQSTSVFLTRSGHTIRYCRPARFSSQSDGAAAWAYLINQVTLLSSAKIAFINEPRYRR